MAGSRINTFTQLLVQQQSILRLLDTMRAEPLRRNASDDDVILKQVLSHADDLRARIAVAVATRARLAPVVGAVLAEAANRPATGSTPAGQDGRTLTTGSDPDGRYLEPGEVLEFTETQAAAWADRFEAVADALTTAN